MVTVRTFLINKELTRHLDANQRFRVSPETIDKNVYSFKGRPLILKRYPNGRVDHREWNSSLSASDNLKQQEDFAIGRIEKILYDNESDGYYADIDITNPYAENWIKSRDSTKIPIRVSPQIVFDARKELNRHNLMHWFGSHVAIVDAGAYGPQAIATNICEAGCPLDLPKGANASLFDFSITEALDIATQSFDTSLVTSDGSNKYQMAMIEVKPDSGPTNTPANNQPGFLAPSPQKEAPYMRDSQSKSPVPITEQPKQEEKQEQNIDYKQLSETLKSELEQAKAKIAESQSVSERLTEHEKKIAKYESENKTREIRDAIPIFLPEFLDKKGMVNNDAVEAKVKDLLKRNFTVDDVKFMYADKVAAFEDSINKPGCESKAANASLIFEVPKMEAAEASNEVPWFAKAAKLLDTRREYSKRPGRVI